MKALWVAFGSYTLVWGLWLLCPWWDVFSTRAGLYDRMDDFMPEWGWGLNAVAVGGMMLGGALYHWPRGIWWGRLAGMYHWALICVFYAMGDWHNTGALTCAFLVVALQIMWVHSRDTELLISRRTMKACTDVGLGFSGAPSSL